jgi:hypothetical protein
VAVILMKVVSQFLAVGKRLSIIFEIAQDSPQ